MADAKKETKSTEKVVEASDNNNALIGSKKIKSVEGNVIENN